MNKAYVVWAMIPYEIRAYWLTRLFNEEFYKVKSCHGHFMNATDIPKHVEANLLWLNEYLDKNKESMVYSDTIETQSPIKVQDSICVVCGWLM